MSVYLNELKKLTPKGRKLIQSCYDRAPNGCRDEDCSPPCYQRAGISFQGWNEFAKMEAEKKKAVFLEGFE